MHQEPENKNAAIKAALPGRLGFGISIPHIQRLLAAAPWRLPPGCQIRSHIRITLDANVILKAAARHL
jgi:hypothetical protein